MVKNLKIPSSLSNEEISNDPSFNAFLEGLKGFLSKHGYGVYQLQDTDAGIKVTAEVSKLLKDEAWEPPMMYTVSCFVGEVRRHGELTQSE